MDRADRRGAPGRHLPRRGLQARADDGRASVGRGARQHRRARSSLLDAAEAAGVERFVLVSTDKAVRPSSVMGASKRIAEMLVADAARRTGRPYVSVRFGNVLGSNGSVVPIFQEQLENERAADDHPPGHDPLLHDDPRGVLADPRRGRPRHERRPVRPRHGRSDQDRRPGSRPRPPRRSRSRHAADGDRRPPARARSSTRSCSTTPSTSNRPVVDKVMRAAAGAPRLGIREDVLRLLVLAAEGREEELRSTLLEYADQPWPGLGPDLDQTGPADAQRMGRPAAEPVATLV